MLSQCGHVDAGIQTCILLSAAATSGMLPELPAKLGAVELAAGPHTPARYLYAAVVPERTAKPAELHLAISRNAQPNIGMNL
jgi:hypothetical protein